VNQLVHLKLHEGRLHDALRSFGDVRVGAIERGVQAALNFAELRFVLPLDSQLSRSDRARIGKLLEVLRF
jgi:hypothetical protein